MVMGNHAIYVDWKYAKNPSEQIGILAEINSCSQEEIRDIIRSQRKNGDPLLAEKKKKSGRGKPPLPKEMLDNLRNDFLKGAATKELSAKYDISTTCVNKHIKDLRGVKKVKFAEEMKEDERNQTLKELNAIVTKPDKPKLGELAEKLLESIDLSEFSDALFEIQKTSGAISITVTKGTKTLTLSQRLEEATA